MATPRARIVTDPTLGAAAVFGGASAVLAVAAVGVLAECVDSPGFGFRTTRWEIPTPFQMKFVAETGSLLGVTSTAAGILISLGFAWIRASAYRVLGVYVWTASVATIAAGLWAFTREAVPWLWCVVLSGSVIGVLAAFRYGRAVRVAGTALWNPMRPVPSVATAALGLTLALVAFALGYAGLTNPDGRAAAAHDGRVRIATFAFALAMMLISFPRFARAAFEWFLSVGYGVMYRGRGYGPGVVGCPPVGPVLVIANHAAIFDPIAVQKACFRPVIGLMSSLYYDRPGFHFMARHIFKTIRVPHGFVRHEAPELKEAVAALDRGECVLIFPEAWLRRKDDVPLKRFAQGVWQILRDRPDTPVIACWIEGMWGSFFSHKNGPIGKKKWFDVRRRVDVGVSAAAPVPAEVLADHWATRFYLMNAVSDARRHVGLEPLPRFDRGSSDVEE